VPPPLNNPPPPPPPLAAPVAFPLAMVRPEIVTVVPALISNTLDELLPLTERLDAPGPLIVKF